MISVIIPAYNEEKRIGKTLLKMSEYMASSFSDYEILVVDDGSLDNTKRAVEPYLSDKVKLLSYEDNLGKGGAVKHGVKNATGDIIIFTDADLPYPPENIKRAEEIIETSGVDFILGVRTQAEGGKKYPLKRRIMSKVFSFFVKTITGLDVHDTQCGFKAFKRDCAKAVFDKTTIFGWGFDVEAIFIAIKYGFSYTRLSVELYHDIGGSKVRAIKDSAKMIKELKKIKENEKNGIYD